MGLFDKLRNKKETTTAKSALGELGNMQGVVSFEDFTLIFKTHSVDEIFWIGLPIGWEPFESDRFRAKTQDEKTKISITNWVLADESQIADGQQLKTRVLPLYEKFIVEGGYEPYDDLIANKKYISRSFKVDEETQYYLTAINNVESKQYRSDFIIRDMDKYNPQMRAILLNIVASMKFI
jgi:hypothetical protein